MSVRDDLQGVLKRLRLTGVTESLEPRLQQANVDGLCYLEFLYRLLCDEVSRRDAQQLQRRLRKARFEQERAIEDFDFTFNPRLPRRRIMDLASCRFVVERRDVLLTGPSGVGKSHLAQALGHQACRAGYSVRYVSASDLLRALRAARADESYEKVLSSYVKPELLIVDDLGLRPLRGEEPHDLYELVRRRYEKVATVWTSNRAIEEWAALFGDPLLASAALDRLLHDAEVLELEGDSYRNPPPQKRGRERPQGGPPGERTGDDPSAGEDGFDREGDA